MTRDKIHSGLWFCKSSMLSIMSRWAIRTLQAKPENLPPQENI